MKDANPKLKVAFVGPPVSINPEGTLRASKAIDFVVRREFDYQVVDYANGKPLAELPGVSYRENGGFPAQSGRRVHRGFGRAAVGHQRSTSATWISRALQHPFPAESVPLLLHRARLARPNARSACGRRPSPDTAGACAPRTTWRRSSAGR